MCTFSLNKYNKFKHNKYSVNFIFLTKLLVHLIQSGIFLHHHPKEFLHLSLELDPLCFKSCIFFLVYSIVSVERVLQFSKKEYIEIISCFCLCTFEQISSLFSYITDVEFQVGKYFCPILKVLFHCHVISSLAVVKFMHFDSDYCFFE